MSLTAGEWASLVKMAQHCAETWHGGTPLTVLTYADRRELALGGMLDHLGTRGWDDDKALFRSGANAIGRAADEAGKHAGRSWFWDRHDGPDWLAEEVTDRVAAVQVLGALTPAERAAVLAMAETGNWRDAAGQLGLARAAMSQRLSHARARARALWIPPDETPGARYAPSRGGKRSRAMRAHYRRYGKGKA